MKKYGILLHVLTQDICHALSMRVDLDILLI